MTKKAFNKIAAGAREALAIARGDITANYHKGNPESKEAFRRLKREIEERDKAYIERALIRRGAYGLICDEAERMLGMKHQTCSARFTDLLAEKRITRTDERRPTRSGRPARVHIIN